MKKKLILLFFFLIFLSFSYGFFFHKYKFFPYENLLLGKRMFNNFFYQQNNKEMKNNIDIFSDQKNIRNQYPDWVNKLRIIKYSEGLNIFSDRNYFNHKNDNFLRGKFLIQIPRHYKKKIEIFFKNETKVYKVLCKTNNNSLASNWVKENSSVLIVSSSCVHELVYSKLIKKGKYEFYSGGPVSADPIFLDIEKLDDINLLNN